jgi:hypothetical protein
MKNIITVGMLLLCFSCYAQHANNAYGANQPQFATSKTPGLTDLIEKPDSITQKVFYYDPRTSVDNIHGNGIFASILKSKGDYILRFIAYHVAPGPIMVNGLGGNVATPVDVTGIFIKTSDSMFAFEDPLLIQSNGSSFPHIVIKSRTMDKNNTAYQVLSSIVKTGYCKLHFESLPAIDDHILSSREISEIETVLKDWLAVNKIN